MVKINITANHNVTVNLREIIQVSLILLHPQYAMETIQTTTEYLAI